jgi:hypothetical protein
MNRPNPYALAGSQPALEALAPQVSAALAAARAQLTFAREACDLVLGLNSGNLPAWTPGEAWGAELEGDSLVVGGPGALINASLRNGAPASLTIETAEGAWEAEFADAGVRVRFTDAVTGAVANYNFGTHGRPRPEGEWENKLAQLRQGWEESAAAAAEAAAAAAASAAKAPERDWYYAAAGKTEGPMPESELRARLSVLPPGAMVWNQALDGWKSPADAGLLPATPAAAAVPASGWELTVQSGPDLGRRYELAGEARVGRSVECEVALADGTASRVHARIRQESGAFWISDNQSMNGTEVNGARIAGSVRLNEGDLIHVGSSDLVFGRAPGCAPAPFPTAATEPAPVQAAHDAPAPAAPVCPACASPVGKGAAFCTNCGRALL